jgi:FtsP/CotA-like multicopper oxidase with cupredoxin domain
VPAGGSDTVVLGSLPDGTWTIPVTADGEPFDQRVTVDCDRPGVPDVDVSQSCVDFDGTVVVTLANTGGDLPVAFVVTDPVTGEETTKVVDPGGTATVSFAGLPDGTFTVAITADGTPLDQVVVVACDRPGAPAVDAGQSCTAQGGEVTVTLANTTPAGEGEPIEFVVTDPTGGPGRTVTVEAGTSAEVVFDGLADGGYTIDVTADGTPWGRIVVEVDCRRPEVLGVLVECVEDGGEVLVLSNDGPTPVELTVLVDGEPLTTVVVPGDDVAAVVIPVGEDESVQVTVREGDDVVGELDVTRDCEEPTPSTTAPPSTTVPPGGGTTLPPSSLTDLPLEFGIPTEVAGVQQTPGTLPRTGGDHLRSVVVALLLVGAGGLLVLASRQRRAVADDPLWRRL